MISCSNMITSSDSEEDGYFCPEHVDLVFVDEDDMPLGAVAYGTRHLNRDSDEEIDCYLTDTEEDQSVDSKDLEQDTPQPQPQPRRHQRQPAPAAQANRDVNDTEDDWKEDTIRHDEIPFTQPCDPQVPMSGNKKPVVLFQPFFFLLMLFLSS